VFNYLVYGVTKMKKVLIGVLLVALLATSVYAMTKSDLINAVSKKSKLTKEQSKKAVDSLFDVVFDTAQRHDPGVALLEITGATKKQKNKAGFLMDEIGHHLGAEEGDVILVAVIKPNTPDSTIFGRKTVRPHDFALAAKEHHYVQAVGFGDGIRGSIPPD